MVPRGLATAAIVLIAMMMASNDTADARAINRRVEVRRR